MHIDELRIKNRNNGWKHSVLTLWQHVAQKTWQHDDRLYFHHQNQVFRPSTRASWILLVSNESSQFEDRTKTAPCSRPIRHIYPYYVVMLFVHHSLETTSRFIGSKVTGEKPQSRANKIYTIKKPLHIEIVQTIVFKLRDRNRNTSTYHNKWNLAEEWCRFSCFVSQQPRTRSRMIKYEHWRTFFNIGKSSLQWLLPILGVN